MILSHFSVFDTEENDAHYIECKVDIDPGVLGNTVRTYPGCGRKKCGLKRELTVHRVHIWFLWKCTSYNKTFAHGGKSMFSCHD